MTQTTTGQAIHFSEFQFWESNTATTTTSETYVEKLSRTTKKLEGGTYIVSWRYEMKITLTGPLNSSGQFQFKIDGNIKGSNNMDRTEWAEFSGWDRYVATAGDEPVFSMEIRREPVQGGNDTIEIRKMKIGIERMG